MNQENGIIYIATNLVNGKQNVGQTIRKLKKRMGEHKGTDNGQLLHKAIKKYGIENFKWISFSCSEEELDWHETFLIKELNTLAPNGYNLETGGHKNKHHHELSKQKISKKLTGRIRTPEHSNNLSKSHTGIKMKKHSEESKLLRSKNNTGEKNPFYNKKHKKKSIQLMSIAKKGKKLSLESIKKRTETQKRNLEEIRKNGGQHYNFGKKQSQKSINKRIKSYKRTIKLKRRMKNV